MAVKLHRCTVTWLKGGHPCWRVEQALQEAGIEYERVLHPAFPRGRRKQYIAKTGTKWLPAVELEDGTIVREESRQLAARIRAGKLRP
jgi:glutathione S-transferase